MRCVLLPFPRTTSYKEEPQQDVEKARQRRSRIAQRLNVRPGQTPVHTGDGWAGENSLRFASSLAAALLDSLFAHPSGLFGVVSYLDICDGYRSRNGFFLSLLELS